MVFLSTDDAKWVGTSILDNPKEPRLVPLNLISQALQLNFPEDPVPLPQQQYPDPNPQPNLIPNPGPKLTPDLILNPTLTSDS